MLVMNKTARMFSGYGLDTRWDVPKRAAQESLVTAQDQGTDWMS